MTVHVAMVSIQVLGLPQPKGSMRAFAFVNKATGKARAVVTAGNNAKGTKAWADMVKLEAQRQAPPGGPWEGPVSISMDFTMQAPKSLPKRKVSFATKKPDFDKLERNVCDALTGVIYRDDAQIVQSKTRKRYGNSPGVMITAQLVQEDDPILGWTPMKKETV